jgi:RNA polymerase sigma-70 factor, ECF subfamily
MSVPQGPSFRRAVNLSRDGTCALAAIFHVPGDSADWQGFPKTSTFPYPQNSCNLWKNCHSIQKKQKGAVRTRMPVTPEREKELIARIIAGETNLFHELIRPYERMVYLSILAMLRNDQEAEDAAQEVMINAFRYLKNFRGDAKFSTWLVTIAMNEARQRLRKAKAAQMESLDEDKEDREGDFTPAVLTDWREIPSEALEKKEMRQKLREAVQQLPPIYREVLVLRDLEELNQEETASALGIRVTLVKVRLHRARMMLQKMLAPYLRAAAPAKKGFFGRMFQ